MEAKQSLKEGRNLTLKEVCEGRENRVLAPILGEEPVSTRGPTRVQYPSRVDENGFGGWLEACGGHGEDS